MKLIPFDRLKPDKDIPYTRQHLGRLEKQGKFPRRVRVGDNRVAWVEDEIDAYHVERLRAREQKRVDRRNGDEPNRSSRHARLVRGNRT